MDNQVSLGFSDWMWRGLFLALVICGFLEVQSTNSRDGREALARERLSSIAQVQETLRASTTTDSDHDGNADFASAAEVGKRIRLLAGLSQGKAFVSAAGYNYAVFLNDDPDTGWCAYAWPTDSSWPSAATFYIDARRQVFKQSNAEGHHDGTKCIPREAISSGSWREVTDTH